MAKIDDDPPEPEIKGADGHLTDKMEHYAQLRASGFSKSKAASVAFETKFPAHRGWETEILPKVALRIRQLKEERAEAFGLSQEEQVRKYHEIYQDAMIKGSLNTAMKALEHIDAIGGFEIKRSVNLSLKANQGLTIKDADGDIQADLKRFSNVLTSHKGSGETLRLEEPSKETEVPEVILDLIPLPEEEKVH